LKYKIVILNCNTISHVTLFYCILDQINAALVSIRDFFRKHLNIFPTPNFLTFFLLQF